MAFALERHGESQFQKSASPSLCDNGAVESRAPQGPVTGYGVICFSTWNSK